MRVCVRELFEFIRAKRREGSRERESWREKFLQWVYGILEEILWSAKMGRWEGEWFGADFNEVTVFGMGICVLKMQLYR